MIESLNSYSENLSFDPDKFNKIQSRLFKIQDLENKHNVSSVKQLINIKDDLINSIENTDRVDKMIEDESNEIRNTYFSYK